MTNNNHIISDRAQFESLYEQGVRDFSNYKVDRSKPAIFGVYTSSISTLRDIESCNFDGWDYFSNQMIYGINFSDCSFRGANFTDTEFYQTTFDSECDLTGAIGISSQETELEVLRFIKEVMIAENRFNMGDWHSLHKDGGCADGFSNLEDLEEELTGTDIFKDPQHFKQCSTVHCAAGSAQVWAALNDPSNSRGIKYKDAEIVGSSLIPSVAHLFYANEEEFEQELDRILAIGKDALIKR